MSLRFMKCQVCGHVEKHNGARKTADAFILHLIREHPAAIRHLRSLWVDIENEDKRHQARKKEIMQMAEGIADNHHLLF